MKTVLLVVGKTVEKYFVQAIEEYVQRTKHYISFDLEVIPELKNTKSLSEEQQKEKEGELILKSLQPGDTVVLLDEHGKELRSVEFADYMKRKLSSEAFTAENAQIMVYNGTNAYGIAGKDRNSPEDIEFLVSQLRVGQRGSDQHMLQFFYHFSIIPSDFLIRK